MVGNFVTSVIYTKRYFKQMYFIVCLVLRLNGLKSEVVVPFFKVGRKGMYTKGACFLSKMLYKKGWTSGWSLPVNS